MKDKIQHILSGTSQVKHHHLIQTTCSYLKRNQGAEQKGYLKDGTSVLKLNASI
jgi:hypothetical protein